MLRRLSTFALLAALVACLAALAGCGAEEEEGHAVEGEPLELGELLYNVQITRFLNEESIEDRAYLEGAEPLAEGEQYLGVFIRIMNEGEEVEHAPETFEIESRITVSPDLPSLRISSIASTSAFSESDCKT